MKTPEQIRAEIERLRVEAILEGTGWWIKDEQFAAIKRIDALRWVLADDTPQEQPKGQADD
jgi:hypothetical protein